MSALLEVGESEATALDLTCRRDAERPIDSERHWELKADYPS